MFLLGAEAVAIGRLVGLSFACGLNLYATIALLGIGSRAGWFSGLPPELRGLENGLVIASAALLYIAEFVADKIPYLDAGWDALHTLIRPLAAALLAMLALGPLPLPLQIAGGAAAGLVALAAHGAKAGLRLTVRAPSRWQSRVGLSLLEDAVAIALVLAVLFVPVLALAVALGGIVGLIMAGPGLWRAAMFGFRAILSRFQAFFGTSGWTAATALPTWLRPALAPAALEAIPPRAAPAALYGMPGPGAFRGGWLIIDGEGAAFVYRAPIRQRRQPLPRATHGIVRPGLLSDSLEMEADGTRFTVFLFKNGPDPESARSALMVSS